MTKHVAVICRKSSRDEQEISLGRQEKIGRQLAEEWWPDVPVVVYADNGVSGTDMNRAGWQAFATAVRAGVVVGVTTYEQSRLTRAGQDTWDEVCVMLWKAGIDKLHTHRQGIIPVAPGNRIQGRLLALLDQEERERTQIRMKDAHANLASEGRPSGGRIYGYRTVKDAAGRSALELVPDEADEIRRMANDLLSGMSMASIARGLIERAVPTARGGKWTTSHIRSTLTKPSVAGLRVHDGLAVPATWPAILDVATWEKACAYLNEATVVTAVDGSRRKVSRVKAQTSRRYLLTGGIATCGLCKKQLMGQHRKDVNYAVYACHPRYDGCSRVTIQSEPFEAFIVDKIKVALKSKKFVALLQPEDTEYRRVQDDLQKVEAKLRTLAARYANDDLTDSEWESARPTLVAREKALKARAEALSVGSLVLPDTETIRRDWDDMTLAQRQQVVRKLVTSIELHPKSAGLIADRVVMLWRV